MPSHLVSVVLLCSPGLRYFGGDGSWVLSRRIQCRSNTWRLWKTIGIQIYEEVTRFRRIFSDARDTFSASYNRDAQTYAKAWLCFLMIYFGVLWVDVRHRRRPRSTFNLDACPKPSGEYPRVGPVSDLRRRPTEGPEQKEPCRVHDVSSGNI